MFLATLQTDEVCSHLEKRIGRLEDPLLYCTVDTSAESSSLSLRQLICLLKLEWSYHPPTNARAIMHNALFPNIGTLKF